MKKIMSVAVGLAILGMGQQAEAAAPKTCNITVQYTGKQYKINNIPIANKQYGMARSFNPGANKTMISAYHKMKAAALKKGIVLDVVGAPGAYGYRSYATQKQLYNNYIYMYGFDYASKISAKPGTSEHQLGLAIDIRDGTNYGTLTTAFQYTAASKFIKENGQRYGFIVRYPAGKESITGFMYEPWHIRYVGVTTATRIKANQTTLEEYLGVAGRSKLYSGTHKVKGYICNY
ncbi:M15 family metallopeptidase [Macrococcus lamae]|uniref:D-alanyl-D-alanine carboxypeptidase family protein n=1 Tax=Macrococcus lamae TaxID=198484 RepID=A0A4R6BU50_9STAP|nr:M15 family metallopeptidase [Macrococcus lamae]TDM10640.1 D-alanyl-D-alanine carboxypeptidase family protein [Macrococcus lamae]